MVAAHIAENKIRAVAVGHGLNPLAPRAFAVAGCDGTLVLSAAENIRASAFVRRHPACATPLITLHAPFKQPTVPWAGHRE